MQYLDKMSSCLYGYTEQFAGAEKARVENHLTIQKKGGVSYKGCRHNGETYSYTEYIRQMLKEGTKQTVSVLLTSLFTRTVLILTSTKVSLALQIFLLRMDMLMTRRL